MAESESRNRILLREAGYAIRERDLVVPGIIALEMLKPVSFLLSQALLLIQPLFGWDGRGWLSGAGASLLENPVNIEALMNQIGSEKHP